MKFLLTTLLSLSIVTNAFGLAFSNFDTSKFVQGCRILIRGAEEGTDDIGEKEGVIMTQSIGYLMGYLDSRSVSVIQHLINTNADRTDYELVEKELYQYVLPENFSPYILAKLIVNKVDSSPVILTDHPSKIVSIILSEEFKLKK